MNENHVIVVLCVSHKVMIYRAVISSTKIIVDKVLLVYVAKYVMKYVCALRTP